MQPRLVEVGIEPVILAHTLCIASAHCGLARGAPRAACARSRVTRTHCSARARMRMESRRFECILRLPDRLKEDVGGRKDLPGEQAAERPRTQHASQQMQMQS